MVHCLSLIQVESSYIQLEGSFINMEYQYHLMDQYGWLIHTMTDLPNINSVLLTPLNQFTPTLLHESNFFVFIVGLYLYQFLKHSL